MDKRTLRFVSGVVGLTGTVWLGLVAAITAKQRNLLFNPIRTREVDRPRSDAHRTRPVVLRGADGTRLCGWLMTPRSRGTNGAVLYFGGRSEEVSWVARDAGRMFPGMTVLAMNYRGYGDSHGIPTEREMVEDGKMLFDWLAEAHSHIPSFRIAAVGRSLGSGVAVQLAAARPVSALVLLTPYDSIITIARRRFWTIPISLVLRDRFESVKYAEQLSAPVMILRAQDDSIVPHQSTDLLAARLANVVLDQVIPDSDHYNIPYQPETQRRIASFLQNRLGTPVQPSGLAETPVETVQQLAVTG